jgi:hypothetical protein
VVNLVVASTLVHAKAMIHWLKLDEGWKPAIFGSELAASYDKVILVRPLDDITSEQYAWVTHFLLPTVKMDLQVRPKAWGISEENQEVIKNRKKSAFS